MEYYKIINEELEKKYGKDIVGRPMYRIVQNSRSLTEKRLYPIRAQLQGNRVVLQRVMGLQPEFSSVK